MTTRRYKVIRCATMGNSLNPIWIQLSPGQIWEMQRKRGGLYEMRWKCVSMLINADQLDRFFREINEEVI